MLNRVAAGAAAGWDGAGGAGEEQYGLCGSMHVGLMRRFPGCTSGIVTARRWFSRVRWCEKLWINGCRVNSFSRDVLEEEGKGKKKEGERKILSPLPLPLPQTKIC